MATPGIIKIKARGKGNPIAVLQPAAASQPSVTPAAAPAPAPPPPKLKVVVRHLPASMTEQEYNILTADFINKETVEWSLFTSGKLPQDRNKPTTYSIAYARARSTEALIQIKAGLNGKPLTDSRGLESRVQVEFAPFQKYPRVKGRLRHDARSGTIDNDAEFISFLDNLKHTGPNAPSSAPKVEGDTDKASEEEHKVYRDPLAVPTPSYEAPILEPGAKVTTTPLVEFIKQQKLNPKIKEKGKGKAAVLAAEEDDAKSTTSSGGGKKRERDRKRRREREKEREKEREREKEKASQVAVGQPGDKGKRADRKAAASAATQNASTPVTGGKSANESGKPARRERGTAGLSAAAILQRDLGLGGSSRGRRARGSEPASEKPTPAVPAVAASSTPAASTSTQVIPPAPPPESKAIQETANVSKPEGSRRQRNRNRDRRKDEAVAAPPATAAASTPGPPSATENITVSTDQGSASNPPTPVTTTPGSVPPAVQSQVQRGRGGRNRGGRGGPNRAPVAQASTSQTAQTAPATSNSESATSSNSPAPPASIPTGPKSMQQGPPAGPTNNQHGPQHHGPRGRGGRGFGPFGPFGPRGGRGRGFPRGGGNNSGSNANNNTTAANNPASPSTGTT